MEHLIQDAKRILQQNWREGFTIPTKGLYPFQWNWDSGFTSIGHSYFNLDFAIKELESLFSSQWENGMLPHIVFHNEDENTYFPNHTFWNTSVNLGASQKPKSSGITQPPVHGFILENLLEKFRDNETLIAFIKDIFPKVVNYHRFLYISRDPEREGLMFIFHPWESGRDNSPLWDESLNRIVIEKNSLPQYERRDTNLAPTDERPTSFQYDRYVYLLEFGKKYRYDDIEIFKESPFLVQDTLMNATLIKSNQSLINIGKRFGFDVGELQEWQQQSKQSFSKKLWHPELNTFTSYDVRKNAPISYKEIGALISLYAGIPSQKQAESLNNYLWSLHERGFYLCPSFDVDSPLFDSKRYWRGPIWSQMNWMIYFGLKDFGFEDTAQVVKNDLVKLVSKMGFYEYYESQSSLVKKNSTGYGGSDFSWTAACTLDLLKEVPRL